MKFSIKKNKDKFYLLALCFTLFSCQQNSNTVSDKNDYRKFFQNESNLISNTQKRVNILNTFIEKDSLQIVEIKKISGEYATLFETTGKIEYLKKAEQALLKVLDFGGLRKDYLFLDLARNCISQHRFKDAEVFANKAYTINANKAAKLVLFDVYLELGDPQKAFSYLKDKEILNSKDFDYLIRLAKWNDYNGDMKAVLKNMEAATKIAEQSKNKHLIEWAYTNLATYYGHAGKIKKSYNYFIKTLNLNQKNAFAKKSIAWIIYSYENNPKEAFKIVKQVLTGYTSPDLYLFMAELSKALNDTRNTEHYNKLFEQTSKNYKYGNMYHSLNAVYLAENKNKYDEAIQLTKLEIKERTTPKVYGLHAYVLNLKGKHKDALQIIKKYVLERTSDPITNYYIAEIYKSNNLLDEVKLLKKVLKESEFELGPRISQRIFQL